MHSPENKVMGCAMRARIYIEKLQQLQKQKRAPKEMETPYRLCENSDTLISALGGSMILYKIILLAHAQIFKHIFYISALELKKQGNMTC